MSYCSRRDRQLLFLTVSPIHTCPRGHSGQKPLSAQHQILLARSLSPDLVARISSFHHHPNPLLYLYTHCRIPYHPRPRNFDYVGFVHCSLGVQDVMAEQGKAALSKILCTSIFREAGVPRNAAGRPHLPGLWVTPAGVPLPAGYQLNHCVVIQAYLYFLPLPCRCKSS